MFGNLLSGPFAPFTVALAILFGLLTLEVVLALLGGTLLGLGADADVDLELDLEADVDIADLGIEAEALDAEAPTAGEDIGFGPLTWLGLGKVPVLIWLAAVLMAFGISGLALQEVVARIFGAPMPPTLASIPAAVAGLWFARSFGSVFARLLPKTETSATSSRHLGRRIGTVTQGTSRRGSPSEVKVTDRFGNTHYLRAEPLRDQDVIEQGTRVVVLRDRYSDGYRLVPLGPEA